MFMNNEHTFALFRDSEPAHGSTPEPPTEGQAGADPRIDNALTELQQARIRPMSQTEADETLGKLSRIQSVAASLMCDVTETLAATNNEIDPAEVLRQAGKLPGRQSKRMAKTAKQLSDMPNVKERFATGDITPNHVNALANAADKVGPDVVDADQKLLEAADQMPPDTFGRHARKWSEKKLIEKGVDPVERQRRAREAKLWVEKDTGLGVLMAKLPRHQYEQVRQAVDRHYLHHHRQDSADGLSPDETRTPKQRLADVVYELLTGRSALSGDIIADQVGIKAKAATQLIVTAPLGVVDGTDPDGQVEIVGVGPVPRRFLQTLSPRHRRGRHDLRPGRPHPVAGPQPATRQRRPTPHRSGKRRRLLPMRSTHAQMRTPPHSRMAPRPGTHRHRQPRRRLPPTPQMDRNQQPHSPTNPQRLPNPTPLRTRPAMKPTVHPRR